MSQLKCIKPAGLQPTPTDRTVIKAFLEIQKNADDIKKDLAPLYFIAAKEVKVPGGKTAVVIFVPYRQLTQYRKLQSRLVREFEKKFGGKHVVIIAQRKIIRKPTKTNRTKQQKRPRSRTVTAVNEAILEDLVYPTDIVAKRLRVRLDTSRLLKVFLNRNDQSAVEYKLDTFAHVYHKLTGRNVQFLFPAKEETKSYSFRKRQSAQKKSQFGTAVKPITLRPDGTVIRKAIKKRISATALARQKIDLAEKKALKQKKNAYFNIKNRSVKKVEAKRLAKIAAKKKLVASKKAKLEEKKKNKQTTGDKKVEETTKKTETTTSKKGTSQPAKKDVKVQTPKKKTDSKPAPPAKKEQKKTETKPVKSFSSSSKPAKTAQTKKTTKK